MRGRLEGFMHNEKSSCVGRNDNNMSDGDCAKLILRKIKKKSEKFIFALILNFMFSF